MLINYGSFMYFAYIFAALYVCIALYFLARKWPMRAKKGLVLALSLINLAQHIFKRQIYPQYNSSTPIYVSTAYNVCAFLIILSPIIILFGNSLLKNFISYVGGLAGMLAMAIPYWFIGQSAFTWEAYRFYICHGLLFVTSTLPVLLGLHKLELRHCWKIGLLFFASLALILLNNALLIKTGNYSGMDPNDVLGGLNYTNPGWSMHPAANMAWVKNIVAIFSPAFLLGNNPWNMYIPILWYAIPVYLGGSILIYGIYFVSKLFKRRFK